MSRKKTTKTTQPTIQAQLAAREKAINETLADMVRVIDAYFLTAPLVFMDGCEGAPGQYIFDEDYRSGGFSKYHEWIFDWMGTLYPRTLECQKIIHELQPLIANMETKEDVDAHYMDLSYASLKFGFLLGYLSGCRTMGTNTDELLKRAKGFTVNDIGWRRWRMETDAKKD